MSFKYSDAPVGNIVSFMANSATYGAAYGAIKKSNVMEKLPMFAQFANGNQIQQAVVAGTVVASSHEVVRAVGFGDQGSQLMAGNWKGFGDELLYDGLVVGLADVAGIPEMVGGFTGSVLGDEMGGYLAIGALAEGASIARRQLVSRIAGDGSTNDDFMLWLLQPLTMAGRRVGV